MKGTFQNRTKGSFPQAIRERIFAEEWEELSKSYPYQHDFLQTLFSNQESMTSLKSDTLIKEITDEDRLLVADMMQWLGTHVGFCFVQKCMKRIKEECGI